MTALEIFPDRNSGGCFAVLAGSRRSRFMLYVFHLRRSIRWELVALLRPFHRPKTRTPWWRSALRQHLSEMTGRADLRDAAQVRAC